MCSQKSEFFEEFVQIPTVEKLTVNFINCRKLKSRIESLSRTLTIGDYFL